MKTVFMLILIFLTPLHSVRAEQEICVDEFHRDVVPESLHFLLQGAAPVIQVVNQCSELYDLPEDQVKKLDEQQKGWPQALVDNPVLCLTSLFSGLKESAEDLLGLIWDLAKSFSSAVNATFWGTYDFFKAAFTGNLAYWFAEASNNADNFATSFLNALKAIPNAIVEFVKDKAADWDCRNDKGQVEMACRLTGYIGGDTLVAALTLGSSKLALAPKLAQLQKKLPPAKKTETSKAPGKGISRGSKLDELIPLSKRDQRMVVEVDGKGHYSVRYFDKDGKAKYFDGSPFYHQIRSHHRKAGIGTNRVKNRTRLSTEGEHFTIDVHPDKFDDFLAFVSQKEGKLSLACTKTACDSMKAAGVELAQPRVPSIDGLYRGLLEESSKTSSAVKRVDNKLTPAAQDALIRKYKTGTNLVKMQFGMAVFSGYIYAPALIGTPMNLLIDRMESHEVTE